MLNVLVTVPLLPPRAGGADVSATSLLAAATIAAQSNDALPGTALLHAVVQAVVDATLGLVPAGRGLESLDDAELEAAAVKIQAVTRGRQQRAARRHTGYSGTKVGGTYTAQSFVDELEDDVLTRLEVSPSLPCGL